MSVKVDMSEPWKRIEQAIEGGIRESVLLVEREVVLEIERDKLEVEGDLKSSIVSDVDGMRASVSSDKEYAPWVHEGTQPHWAPIQPLRNWVQRKFGESGDDLERTARAVQASIAKKGTKPHPFMKRALETWQKKLPRILRDLIGKRLK